MAVVWRTLYGKNLWTIRRVLLHCVPLLVRIYAEGLGLQVDRKRTQSVFKIYSECRNSDERGRINSAQKQGQNHAVMEKISFNRFLTAFENNGRWDVISAWTLSVNTIKMKELVHLLSHVNAFWLKVQKTNDLRIHFILANVYIIWSKFIGEVWPRNVLLVRNSILQYFIPRIYEVNILCKPIIKCVSECASVVLFESQPDLTKSTQSFEN